MGFKMGGGGGGISRGLGYAAGPYAAMGQYASDRVGGGKGLNKLNPFDTSKSHGLAKQGEQYADDQYAESQRVNDEMTAADQAYGDAYGRAAEGYRDRQSGANKQYLRDIDRLGNEAVQQSKDARSTYTNTIQPRLKASMEEAGKEAAGAMSLKDAGDPNNSVQRSVRAMYDQQAKGAQKQGMADFGTMSALGAQAAGQQFGAAGPMTTGQMGQIYAQNQGQAGNAYAVAQQRMHNLQQQGIDRGFEESSRQYDRGQAAKDRYRQSIGDIDSAESSYMGKQAGLRDERGSYMSERHGIRSGENADRFNMARERAGIATNTAYGRGERDLAAQNQKYGYKQQGITNRIGIEEGARKGKLDTFNQSQQTFGQMTSGMGSAAVAASDERVKHGIRPVKDEDLDEFFGAINPKTYDYDDPYAAGRQPGRRIGFMLQDVEDTKLGRQIMRPGPNGEKMYDKDNLNGIIMAGLARQARKAG